MCTKFGSYSNLQSPQPPLRTLVVLKHCQPSLISPWRITPVTGGCWVNTNAVFIPFLVWLRWEHRQLAASLVPGNYISSGIYWKHKLGWESVGMVGELGRKGGGGGNQETVWVLMLLECVVDWERNARLRSNVFWLQKALLTFREADYFLVNPFFWF